MSICDARTKPSAPIPSCSAENCISFCLPLANAPFLLRLTPLPIPLALPLLVSQCCRCVCVTQTAKQCSPHHLIMVTPLPPHRLIIVNTLLPTNVRFRPGNIVVANPLAPGNIRVGDRNVDVIRAFWARARISGDCGEV